MPKATFAQITPEKRERVLSEAARLFAERGYNQTDMAQLAARAGVAKGSLYNYFASKEELYVHVCRDGLERSRAAVYGELDPDWDIYRQIDHIFRRGVAFARSHPAYIVMYLNISSPGMERFADKLTREVESFTAGHLKRAIRRGQAEGTVRADLDVNLSAFTINTLYIMLLASLVSRHFQIRLREYLELKGRINAATVNEHLGRTIQLIERHLRPAESAGSAGA